MSTDRIRRQVLRAVGGLMLAPVSARLPAVERGTCVHDPQQVQIDLLAALEVALLQIDWNDMRDVLTLMGNAPTVCSVLIGPDVGAVVKQCSALMAQHPDRLNALLVVVSGNQSMRLDHCRAVFAAVTNASRTARGRRQSRMNTPPMVLYGVVVDVAISDGLRVTVLAG